MNRKIGDYGGNSKGPLIIAFAGVHGNEPAGLAALEQVFNMLEQEPAENPDFLFQGKIVGIAANLEAISQQKRFIHADLNRLWTNDVLDLIQEKPTAERISEEAEVLEIAALVQAEIKAYPTNDLIFLDLHTTSAGGGIFSIPADENDSLALAKTLFAPAVLGIMNRAQGTLMQFAIQRGFVPNSFSGRIRAVAFESGQHEDPLSIQRAIASVINCLRGVGCVAPADVDGRHDAILIQYSKKLPSVVRLQYAHHINPTHEFSMKPGYANFQPIKLKEHLANDVNGPIFAPMDGLILMPLYQKLGSDGFFIAADCSEK